MVTPQQRKGLWVCASSEFIPKGPSQGPLSAYNPGNEAEHTAGYNARNARKYENLKIPFQ